MSGRLTQLGRQLRKLRTIIGGAPSADPVTTLRRATRLACDLACEHAGVEEPDTGFRELARRGLLDPALAERIIGWVAALGIDVTEATALREGELGGRAMQIGRDLDRFLRSLEIGASAAEIPFAALVPRESSGPKPDSTAGVTVSGRLVELEVRDGRATVSIDDQLIAMARASGDPLISFELTTAPTSRPEVHRELAGVTRVVWSPENITLELAPDFSRVQIGDGSNPIPTARNAPST
ncbi:MAG: hypothetical protein ABI678_05695 [Kofleriaceae bacterium]